MPCAECAGGCEFELRDSGSLWDSRRLRCCICYVFSLGPDVARRYRAEPTLFCPSCMVVADEMKL